MTAAAAIAASPRRLAKLAASGATFYLRNEWGTTVYVNGQIHEWVLRPVAESDEWEPLA